MIKPGTVILQTAGKDRYSGALLHERFQVLESTIFKKKFIMIDHLFMTDDLKQDWKAIVRHPKTGSGVTPEPIIFASVEEAETYAAQLASGEKAPLTEKPPKAAPVQKLKAETKPSMAGLCRKLVLEGTLPDEEIFNQVVKEFPNFRRTSVDWYRKELQAKGLLK